MKKILILLLASTLVLFGCAKETTQSNDSINNDANEKTTVSGINVSFTSEINAENDGQTTYYVEVTLLNETNDDINLAISGFGARAGSTYFGTDETLTVFEAGEYKIPANDSIMFPIYFTIPTEMVIEEVLLYDANTMQYIFE